MKILWLLLISIIAFADNKALYYQAMEEFMQENDSLGMELLQKGAENGEVDSAYELGEIYYYGDIVGVNKKKAFQYLKQAADDGSLRAKDLLNSMCTETPIYCKGN